MRLGVDNFSLRFNDWDALQHLEYAQSIGLEIVHFSDTSPFQSLDDGYLSEIKQTADHMGLAIEIGMGSICPTSTTFSDAKGSAVEQLSRTMSVAAKLGSPAVRCFLGANADRRTSAPLSVHFDATIATCQAVRDLALDLGVKIAIENHAGDMQGAELRALIERAGPDFVGACLDSGNPLWVAESPFTTLEELAPYVLMTHIRDTVVAPHPAGAFVQWVALGEGNIDMPAWTARLRELCPSADFTLEIISTLPPRILPYLDPAFWLDYPDMRAADFARFLQHVQSGALPTAPALTANWADITLELRIALAQEQQRKLEQSVQYCRNTLGIRPA